jgi:hypothetical protein
MTQPLYITTDKKMNTRLAGQVAGLRGGMVAQAEKRKMPARFDAVPHPDHPSMIISDIKTGRSVIVPLFAYGEVRAVLSALFA